MRWLRFVAVAALAALVGAMVAASALGGGGARSGTQVVRVEEYGLSIRIPAHWHRLPPAEPYPGFELYTGAREVNDPACTGVDSSAHVSIGPLSAPTAKRRPDPFTERDGKTDTWSTIAEIQCDEIWQRIRFTDGGQHFYVLIRTGRRGPDTLRNEALAILDTLKVRT